MFLTQATIRPVHADSGNIAGTAEKNFDRRFYAGVGLGFSNLRPDTRDLFNTELNDKSGTGAQLLTGMDIDKWLSMEMRFTQLGSAEFTNGSAIEYQQFGGSAIFYIGGNRGLYNRRGLNALGRVGVGFLKNSARGGIEYEQVNSTHFLYVVDLEYSSKGNMAALYLTASLTVSRSSPVQMC